MKKRFGKQILCYLLSLTLFMSALQVPTMAAEVSSNNETGQSAISQQLADENTTETSEMTIKTADSGISEKSLDFECNGGTFRDGYEPPDFYPVEGLPDEDYINKPGYSFAGWYDNQELTGEAVTEVNDTKYTGSVVLYAKWADPYYYVDIPAVVATDGSEIKISAEAYGLYDQEAVKVSIHSENDWNLKSNDALLSYQFREKDSPKVLGNDVYVMYLTSSNKSEEKEYVCEVTQEATVVGQYKDTLTFEIGYETTNYTIDYEANGGLKDDPDNPGDLIAFEKETFSPGTALDNLPIAIKTGYTFLGWCYDEECTKYVSTTDRLLSDITLYAAYTENQQFESHSIATFARAIDVDGASLVIQVTDQSGALSTEQILNACTLTNLSDFTEEITLILSDAGNNTYTISKENGWKEGSNYKLVLDNDDLYFTGFDTTIREYEISIHKDEVKNLSLNQDIKYINVKELSNLTVNGQSVQSVSIATMTLGMDGTVREEGSSATGSFTYTERPLRVGDQIAVYAGDVIPDMDTVVASADGSNISFFEITAVNGTTYSYRGSKTEDVLFMPDVLPLDLSKDKDGELQNNSVTVDVAELTFDDSSANLNPSLSADTTVDEGDYLALYTDINRQDTLFYGKITSVLLSEGQYIINYQPQTWEEVMAAMDVYTTQPLSGEDLLGETDVEVFESNIEAQAIASGFADKVAEQIGEMAIRTDSFAELERTLSEEFGADVEITGDTQMQMQKAAGLQKRVEVGLPQVRAELNTKLRHFDGNESGLHLGLEVSVPITFHVARYADFTITVTATFEQEVRVAINVDGEAVWKTWGIFPYIADYRVTASMDLYEYTGIALDINFKTEQANNYLLFPLPGVDSSTQFKKKQKLANNVENIINELEDMMENGKEYISDKSPLMADINDSNDIDEDKISVAKSLAERYADLIEDDGEWVELYTREIKHQHFRIIYVIDIALELDFVVWAKVNVSIGMSFWYKNAKRYVFTLHVKGRKATSDTINITEEQYEFTAYAMGTIGIKAGVRLTIRVGLISTELASVGLSAEVGGYVQLWGYLYYILKYSASNGRDSRAIGALYLELGIYLDIKFRATALSSAFTYSPTIFEAMWPLFTAGTRENVLDFVDTEETVCEMKYEYRQVRLPDDFFNMNYMDMKEGLDDGEYFTKIYEDDSDKYFKITMTNDAFTYDPKTNLITVDPGSEKSVDGEMIVTWKNQPGTFNTKPFQKKVKLHWDMLRDAYVIAFISNGGSYVPAIGQKYGTEITKPADPKKQGYVFAGWYRDAALTQPYTIPSVMPDESVIVYAKWEPAQVKYTVKSYLQGVNGVYEIAEDGIETGKAYTDSTISPQPKVREGFETPLADSVTVDADGSTMIEYYYTREKYTATFKSDGEVVSTDSYRYGSMMPVPAVYKPGYDFVGWIPEGKDVVEDVPMEVPAKDTTYYASWKPQSGIGYTVKYYLQEDGSDSYSLNSIEYLTGETGATVVAPAGNYDAMIYHLKDNAPLPSGEIKADGSLELRVYYDLNTYTVTYDTAANDATMPEEGELTFTARPGQKILTEIPERKGYRFTGWYLDAACTTEFDNTMPSYDITLYAGWEREKVNYTVRHLQEDLAILNEYGYPEGGEATYTIVDEEVFSALPGEDVSPAVKSYEGFTSPAVVTKTVTVDENGNGTLVIEYKYSRNEYTIEWQLDMLSNDGVPMYRVQEFQYGATIIRPSYDKEIVKAGYHVDGWYEDEELTTPFTSETMPAHDIVAYPNWVAEDIEYTVWYQFFDGDSFQYAITETLTGLADSVVAPPEVKTFDGYTFDEAGRLEEHKINPNDPDVTYKYNINSHTVTYIYETNEGPKTETVSKKYGEDITNSPVRDGYAFAGWFTDEGYTNQYLGSTMPDNDITLYGKWKLGEQSYQVLHYLKQLDGTSVKLYMVENLSGRSGTEVTPDSKAPEGFEEVETSTLTLTPGSVENNRIVYEYPRKQYQVTYHFNGGTSPKGETETLYYEEEISNAPSRDGYWFAGWYTDESLQTPLTDKKMPAQNLELYAEWKALESRYIVKHYRENANTGDYNLFETGYDYAHTDSIVEPPVKQYYGYTSPAVKSGTVSGDSENPLVIEYYYACNKHNLTLKDSVLEDNVSAGDVTREAKCGSIIQAQTRRAYDFGGWYTDAEYTEKYTGIMPDYDLTLYAKWIPQMRNYQFVYRMQNTRGRYVETDIVKGSAQVDSFVTPPAPDYTGFITPEISPVKIKDGYNNNTYYYGYQRQIHTVTFKLDNGESDIVKRGYYGSEIIKPAAPKKEGYIFTGWDAEVENTIPDRDLTYTAQWTIGSYHIAFMVDNEDLGATYEYGQKIVIPANPTKPGYIFKGWSADVPETMPGKNLNLTAVWELEKYNITCNLNGGVGYYPSSYTYNSAQITLAKPTDPTGYKTFVSWRGTDLAVDLDDPTTYVKTVKIPKNSTGDRHYEAIWEETKYIIQFVSKEGALGIEDMEITYSQSKLLPKVTNIPKGYSFKGWSLSEDSSTVVYKDGATISHVNSGKVLYAVFEPNKHTVTFDFNKNPKFMTTATCAYYSSVPLPEFTTKDGNRHYWGYNLDGWDVFKDKSVYSDAYITSDKKNYTLYYDSDVTIKARWKPNGTYIYEPSDYMNNTYDITDDKNREISFTFYVDGKQTKVPVTGDYGLGNGADYVINMHNMSYDVVSKNFSKIKIKLQCNLTIVHDGYAKIRISYKPKNGKEVLWKTESKDLQDAKGVTEFPQYVLERTDIEYFKIEFDADGGKIDEYLLWGLNVKFEYE